MAETTLQRIRVIWTGIPTGNGVSTFFSQSGQVPDLATLRAGLDNIKTLIPAGVTLTVEGQGDTIGADDGGIEGAWSTTAPAAVVGTGAGTYAAPTGACITWVTDEIHGRRHLKGRTFFVPLVSACFTATGQISAGTITGLNGVGAGVLAAATGKKFCVWGRPTRVPATDPPTVPAPPAVGGMGGIITSFRVPTKAMVLTSRRD